jgi:hypothetical protein
MRRLTIPLLLSLAVCSLTAPTPAAAQDARKRQAAAEAYDRGTAAYLDGDYAEAAQWFETANRLAPAAPALMQAVRANQRAERFARAATLALRLKQDYADVPQASDYADGVLNDLSAQFVRVDVTCDVDCKLDLDGKLQEFRSFFLEPGSKHTVVATFETGSRTEEVSGEAGSTQSVNFVAPPPPPNQPDKPEVDRDPGDGTEPMKDEDERKPLAPLYTYIGAGVTGALLIGTIVSGVSASAGVSDYEAAAKKATACVPADSAKCKPLYDDAKKLLSDGESKETLTNILIAATAVVGVGTGVIALFLTDWSGEPDDGAATEGDASLRVVPTIGGAYGVIEGRF